MCDLGHSHPHQRFGFLVDVPEVRALVRETERLTSEISDHAARVEALRPAFATLLASEAWLPAECARPDDTSKMGGGIGQYALYRAENGSLCLFSLVVPAGAATPVHDHLAWGLVGLYQGDQEEEEYEAHDHEAGTNFRPLNLRTKRVLKKGDFYELVPPWNDVHRVRTISSEPSVSLHLLANDIGCVVRQKFDTESGRTEPFRSGWSNAPCEER